MVYRLSVDRNGAVALPAEVMEILGLKGVGFVRIVQCGSNLVMEKSNLFPVTGSRKTGAR